MGVRQERNLKAAAQQEVRTLFLSELLEAVRTHNVPGIQVAMAELDAAVGLKEISERIARDIAKEAVMQILASSAVNAVSKRALLELRRVAHLTKPELEQLLRDKRTLQGWKEAYLHTEVDMLKALSSREKAIELMRRNAIQPYLSEVFSEPRPHPLGFLMQ